MNNSNRINTTLIAPCGINCALCMAYQREKNKCPGCNGSDEGKPKSCVRCEIKNCEKIKASSSRFCTLCNDKLCPRMKTLHSRYSKKYDVDVVENIKTIKAVGVRNFIKQEEKKWLCKSCGGLVSMHRDNCLRCGAKKEL